MEDASKMLSQEEIDAMISKTAVKAVPVNKVTAGSQPAAAKPAASASLPNVQKVSAVNKTEQGVGHHGHKDDECIAAGEIKSLHEQVSEIVNRLSRLELAVTKLENDSGSPGAQAKSAELKSALQQIQNVSSQVEVISEGLRGTAGYNISKVFNCSSCGTMGVVAVKVKCTKCGQENWWGWWPKKK